jgi:DNA-binding GntR family transcriptional regulator
MQAREPDNRVLIDQVVTRLEDLIFSGHLQAGEKLREQSLAEGMGVSRGPLREAIRTLEGRRLLERTPHSGVQVVGLSIDDLDQILRTREALEGMAARQAAENMTVAEITSLKQVLLHHDECPQDVADAVYRGSENDFHRIIARGSRNRWLMRVLVDDLYSLLRLYRFRGAQRADVTISLAQHHLIVERIHARDPDGAEAVMRAHMRSKRERTLEGLRNSP